MGRFGTTGVHSQLPAGGLRKAGHGFYAPRISGKGTFGRPCVIVLGCGRLRHQAVMGWGAFSACPRVLMVQMW